MRIVLVRALAARTPAIDALWDDLTFSYTGQYGLQRICRGYGRSLGGGNSGGKRVEVQTCGLPDLLEDRSGLLKQGLELQ